MYISVVISFNYWVNMKENFDNLCRVCLDGELDHVSIIGNHNVQLHLKTCLGIVVTACDKFPKTICVPCVSQLNSFYNIILNARCSQDWLESILEENNKTPEKKLQIQPLPDCEYNSDSLLEFLNNTANIDEYLSNLGKEDIPSIVNMLDKNTETSMEAISKLSTSLKSLKEPSPKKKESPISNCDINMEIDVLDSDIEIVKEILMKETKTSENKTKTQIRLNDKTCHGCKCKFESLQKLTQHVIICDMAVRTCSYCFTLFDSRKKMLEHCASHHHCTCKNQNDCIHRNGPSKTFPNFLFKCKRCGVAYEDRVLLLRHIKQHVIKDISRVCDVCGHKFYGEDELVKHKKEIHPSLQNVHYKCKICNETSKSHMAIYNHVKEHTLPKVIQRHLCETCGQSLTTRSSLQRHLVTKHNIREPKKRNICDSAKDDQINFMCESCGEMVTDSKIMKSHTCAVLNGGRYKFLVKMSDE